MARNQDDLTGRIPCTVGDGASGSAMKDGADTGADASRRHLCTRFALRPWAVAIRATDASGLEHSASWASKAALWRRRMSCLVSSMVSTYRSLVDTILASRPASNKMAWPDAYSPLCSDSRHP